MAQALRDAEVDVVVSYLPVGSEEATKFYAQAAILALNGTAVGQRTLTVNEARPREARSSSFGTGGGDRGSSGRRY